MTVFTYARVSTLDQNTDMQEKALKGAYPKAAYREEKVSGTSMNNCEMPNLVLDMIGQGDKLVVWKLDRLARNMNDLTNIVQVLNSKGATLEILEQKIDTSTALVFCPLSTIKYLFPVKTFLLNGEGVWGTGKITHHFHPAIVGSALFDREEI